jgi:hypothetical protein
MRQRIRFREIENIEEKPGIYEIYTDSGVALKVGIATRLRKRLLQHRASRQSCLKLKPGGQWNNPNDVMSKGSILAKHLYYDGSITTEYDLSAETGRRAFLCERCYIVFEITRTKLEARELERDRESDGRYRYLKMVQKRGKGGMNMLCECRCGEASVAGSFKPGHDQKLRTDLERRVGGLLALRSLVESAEAFAAGKMQSDTLAHEVRSLFKAT